MAKSSDKQVALLLILLNSFITLFMEAAVGIALPSIGKEFAIDAVLLSWVATSTWLASAMFLVPFGKLADIYGRKKFFGLGIISIISASFLAMGSKSALGLIIAQFLQGIGGAMTSGTAIAILLSVFPAEERGKVLGIHVTAVYSGLLLGPIFGGYITQYFGWRSLFLINIIWSFIIIALIFWKLKGEWVGAKGEKYDLGGSIIYGLMLLALLYGFSQLPTLLGIWLFLIGIIGLFIFIKREISIKNPILDLRFFRNNRVFVFSNLTAVIYFVATSSITFLLSLYLQYIKGLSPQEAGIILVAQSVIQACVSPVAGRFSDRYDPQRVVSLGMALNVVGLALFTRLTETTKLGFIITSLIILGMGSALFSSPNTNVVMSSVDKKFYGVTSGIRGTMRLIGQMLSMGIVMLLFSLYMGRVQITPESYQQFMNSIHVTFVIGTALCIGGIFTSLVRDKGQ